MIQTVRAEDSGGKYSTATVNVIVTDINDQNPIFLDEPYVFSVKEGLLAAAVGRVQARDNDSSENANIYYTVRSKRLFLNLNFWVNFV